MSRLLTIEETSDLLWRHPVLYARVTAHKALVMTGEWSQVYESDGIDIAQLPISPNGYTFIDERYGPVVIFPGADGKLYFNADVTAAQAAAVTLPPYVSPSGITIQSIMDDIQEIIGNAATAIFYVALAIGAFLVYRELR